MTAPAPMSVAFRAALADAARDRFTDDDALAAGLADLRAASDVAYPDLGVADDVFAAELARRLGDDASPAGLAGLRADHVYLAIACAAGDPAAIGRFEAEFFPEIDACTARVRARPDDASEVRGLLRRILFVSEPGRPAATTTYAGRGDLRSYVRVIATRELLRLAARARRTVAVDDDVLELLSPAGDPALDFLRDHYRADVDAALRSALAALADQPRALLRYHLIDGWSIDRIGALYGIHRATAARWVASARDTLGTTMRTELASRLAISASDVDSIVRLVQSRLDVSLDRLLDAP